MQDFLKWSTSPWLEVVYVAVSTFVVYAMILLFTRVAGLRSFSKMSAADFAMTIAVGSLFASTVAAPKPTLVVGLVSLACLFAGQWLLAWLRRKVGLVSGVVDNAPLLLMAGNRMLEANLRKANVTDADVYGKLREANALNYDDVIAVVFETTGDISVLHGNSSERRVEPDFVRDVIGHELLFETAPSSTHPASRAVED